MTEPRIPLLSPEESRKAAAEVGLPEFMADLNVFRMALQSPKVAKALNDMLGALLFEGNLDAKLRELIIMRLGWVTGSVYEWTQHWRVAKSVGMSDEEILGVRDWPNNADYGPAERAVLAATDETLATGTVGDATWKECVAHVGDDKALFEMVVAIGNWRMFSSLLNTLGVPLEDGVVPWPPDGKVATYAPPGQQ